MKRNCYLKNKNYKKKQKNLNIFLKIQTCNTYINKNFKYMLDQRSIKRVDFIKYSNKNQKKYMGYLNRFLNQNKILMNLKKHTKSLLMIALQKMMDKVFSKMERNVITMCLRIKSITINRLKLILNNNLIMFPIKKV